MTIRKTLIALSGATMLAAAPASALAQQDAEMAQLAAIGQMFEVEPLTPEQEARLPLARQIVEKVMPEGAMTDVLGSTFDDMLGPMMMLANEDAGAALLTALGYRPEELQLDDAGTAEVLAIIDPSWRERNAVIGEVMESMMADMMTRMEPVMRGVMGELYAIYFDDQELRDISSFFDTASGLSFARQSYAMAGDPRIMASMFSDPELIFGAVSQMPAQMEAAMADLPQSETYASLTAQERARIATLTGLSKTELEQAMAAAAEAQAMGM